MLVLVGGCVTPNPEALSEQSKSAVERNKEAAARYAANSSGGGRGGSGDGVDFGFTGAGGGVGSSADGCWC